MAGLVLALLVAAGAALVAQNLLMARIADGAPTILVALVTNSGVGLLVLTMLLVRRLGLAGVGEAAASARPWFVLPGLLGSFFVYASIVGYQRIGPGATIATLVASQLVIGLAVQLVRSHAAASSFAPAILGAALLVSGAWLVASGPI